MKRYRVVAIDPKGVELWRWDVSAEKPHTAEDRAIQWRRPEHSVDPPGTRYVVRALKGPA